MSKKAIDFLLWEEGFYPFSFKYNLEKAVRKHNAILNEVDIDPTSKSIFTYSVFFNSYFKEICKSLSDALSKSLLSRNIFIELIIADLNRNEVLISEDTRRTLLSGNSFDRSAYSNTYIQKPEFQNRSESAWGLIDAAIDTAILNLNYLKHVNFSIDKDIEDEIEQVEVIRNISYIGSSYNIIKHAYDKVIWGGYTIEEEDSCIKLKIDPHHLMLSNVALTRLTNNTLETIDSLLHKEDDYNEIKKFYHKTRQYQEIKSVDEKGDDLKIVYQSKKNELSFSFIKFSAALLAYYPFYRSKQIAAFENLTLLDLVNLFSILHDLVDQIPMPDYEDTGIVDLTKFRKFAPKLKKADVLIHLKKTSKYNEKQILAFLSLLIQQGDNHYLYRYPIYQDGDLLFFTLPIFKRANILYLLDRWLDSGNCDLSDRGFEFENYINSFLKNETLNEFAKFEIVDRSKFYFKDSNNNKFEEEIDLVLKTENKLIVAEVKCITYPLEPNDFYSSYQTIKKAKDQVVRKAKFLEDNWSHFKSDLGDKGVRTIERIIIVNFPHFAGRIIEGIPITDFYLFLSYFKNGQLTKVKLERGKMPIFNSIKYYDSIKSFENNFGSFFINPIPIADIMERQEIQEYEVTVQGIKPKVMAQRVYFKPLGQNEN